MTSSSSPAAPRRRPLFKKILLTLAILLLVLAIAATAFLFRPMAVSYTHLTLPTKA